MKRLIDLLVEAAKELGAESFDVSLSAIRKKAMQLDVGSDYKESSYDAELNYHAVNMRSRFPNPPDKNKIGSARWKDEPYFYRVSIGVYRLLSGKDKEIFRLAVQNNLDIVYKDEYDFGILRNIYKNKENIKSAHRAKNNNAQKDHWTYSFKVIYRSRIYVCQAE